MPSGPPVFALFADIVAWFWTYVPSGTNVYALLSRKKSTGRCKLEKCLARLLISVCGFVQPCQGSSEKINFLSTLLLYCFYVMPLLPVEKCPPCVLMSLCGFGRLCPVQQQHLLCLVTLSMLWWLITGCSLFFQPCWRAIPKSVCLSFVVSMHFSGFLISLFDFGCLSRLFT